MTHALRASSLARVAIVAVPVAVALAASSAPLGLYAQESHRDQLLVSAEWLAQHLEDPNLVLLHVGDPEDYAAEHIPGSRYSSHRELSAPSSTDADALTLELPEPALLQVKLRDLGISNDSHIVVYWGSEWVSPAARVVFTLSWAGLGEQTVLLDGGIEAWKSVGNPVTSEPTPVAQGNVTVVPQDHLVVDADWIQSHAHQPGYQLVDGRNAQYFDGAREDRGKTGHIPGAGNVMWQELLDDSLRIKDDTALKQAFEAAGVEPGDTVVAYCHIGQYATVVMLLARLLGHEAVLYDGAFQDWARRDLPVEKPDR